MSWVLGTVLVERYLHTSSPEFVQPRRRLHHITVFQTAVTRDKTSTWQQMRVAQQEHLVEYTTAVLGPFELE